MTDKPIFRKPFFVDVDDTLVLWDTSEYEITERVIVHDHYGPCSLIPHQKNINLLIKFAKLGYHVHVHSQSGVEWAQQVVRALDLDKYVASYGDKPMYYMDDLGAEHWMRRIWRDPINPDEPEPVYHGQGD